MRAGARPPQRHSRAASGASAAPRPRCCPGHHRPVACAAAGGTGAGGGGAPSSLASGVRTAEAAGAVAAVQPPPPAPAPLPPPRPGPPSLVYVCDVEERALQNALRTAEAAEAGTLPRRALAYAAVDDAVLSAAYDRCGTVTEDYGRTFYMVWCRRTDELERLDAVFAGRPFDLLDAALTDTVASFPVDVTPFYDMIDGMRMDLVKSRYETFTELAEYCYRVAGTVALMCVPIMGLSPEYSGPREPVFRAALALGMANQLTNILRDVGEDARQRGRVYIPLEDLRSHGISDTEVVNGSLAPPGGPVDPRWKALMAAQIARARGYFAAAEAGVSGLDRSARWPVWAALILYSRILDAIEANGYDSFNVRAYVPGANKLALLPFAFAKAQLTPTLVYAAPAAAAPAAAAAAAAKAQEGAAAGAVAEAEAEARAAHAR